MTEEEAQSKWCPMVRADIYPDASNPMIGNRGDVKNNCTCIGSACMMWRWNGTYRATKAGPLKTGNGEHGYCGLAGRP